MSFARLAEIRHTLAFRLSLTYAAIFTLSAFAVFLFFYLLIEAFIYDHAEEALLGDFKEYAQIEASFGRDALIKDMSMEAELEGKSVIFARLLDAEGRKLWSSDLSDWGNPVFNDGKLDRLKIESGPFMEKRPLPGRSYRGLIFYGRIGDDLILEVGKSLEDADGFLRNVREFFMPIMGMIMVGAAVVGWFMARRALSGVQAVTKTALDISGGDLTRRVPLLFAGSEIDRLAETFNGMLDRIETLIRGMREMTDNIAHDLRSPLTRLRGMAELALTGQMPPQAVEEVSARTIEECDRLLSMINTMLDIAGMESGTARLRLKDVDFADILRYAVELFADLAEDKGVALKSHIPDGVFIRGDRQMLQRMAANLIENGIKYTPGGGSVSLSLESGSGMVTLIVRDSGIGFTENDLPHAFDRFYRGDKSRSEPGAGLGLSLVRAVVLAHGGNISVSNRPDGGAVFFVILPTA